MDLKPQNIMMINSIPKIADFGFSKIKKFVIKKLKINFKFIKIFR